MNTLLFCCCCCCCCCEREREREREDVSHRESTKRDDTFSTERARTRKGVRGKEVLLLRRRLPPLYLRKAHRVFVFNPQQEEYPKKKGEEKSTKKTQTLSSSPSGKPNTTTSCWCCCFSLFGGFFDLRRKQHQQLYLRTVVASAWNAPVSEKNESGVILSDISARRARRARFARLARALDSERDFPFFSSPVVTPQNDSDKWKECRSFFNRGGRRKAIPTLVERCTQSRVKMVVVPFFERRRALRARLFARFLNAVVACASFFSFFKKRARNH